jgi:hypothetical protein
MPLALRGTVVAGTKRIRCTAVTHDTCVRCARLAHKRRPVVKQIRVTRTVTIEISAAEINIIARRIRLAAVRVLARNRRAGWRKVVFQVKLRLARESAQARRIRDATVAS